MRVTQELAQASQNFFSAGAVSDGLGPMQRWERDCGDAATVSIIVQRVAEGERLKQICRSRGWPYAVVAQWITETEDVAKRYDMALRIAADEMAMSTVEIADEQEEVVKKDGTTYDPDVGRDKLRVDTRLKLAGKLYQDRYGEKVQHSHTLDPFSDMLRRVSEKRLASLKAAQLPQPEKDVTPVSVVSVVEVDEDPI